jgi:cytochrome c oxidase cbb3-type subunit II
VGPQDNPGLPRQLLGLLSDEQEAHFLNLGLVEHVPDAESATTDPARPVYADAVADADEDAPADEFAPAAEESGAVDECLATLAHLDVPATAGAPTARKYLRDAGHRFGNDVIAHAVKRRKSALSALSADDDEAENFEVVTF